MDAVNNPKISCSIVMTRRVTPNSARRAADDSAELDKQPVKSSVNPDFILIPNLLRIRVKLMITASPLTLTLR